MQGLYDWKNEPYQKPSENRFCYTPDSTIPGTRPLWCRMLIGYARVSTEDQDPAMQIKALEAAGCERIYTDHASGKNMRRPQWKKCRMDLREGDTLVIWKLDRLARSVFELHKIANDFKVEGIDLKVLTENIETGTASGRLLFSVLGAVAEMERELISERTKAAIDQKRAEGFIPGGLPAITPKIWPVAIRIVAEHNAEKKALTDQRLSDLVYDELGERVSWNTYRKWRARLEKGGDYPEDWAAKLKQHAAYKRKARKRQK